MKILKRILLFLLSLVIIALIVALFVKKDYAVERSVTINKPKTEVFDYIKYLKNQDNYSKWAKMDANMKKTYTGTDATPGFISAWDSDKKDVGKGEQEIKKIADGARVDYELRFKKPWESTAQSYLSTDSVSPTQTKVSWGITGHMPYPMNIMQLFMNMDKMLGSDLEIGLGNLKVLEEK